MDKQTLKNTWQGRQGTQTTWHVHGGQFGLRVIEHQWADEPTVSIRVVEGDGRRTDFAQYLDVSEVESGQGEILAASL